MSRQSNRSNVDDYGVNNQADVGSQNEGRGSQNSVRSQNRQNQESNHPSRNPSRQNQESNHASPNPSRQNQESNHPSRNPSRQNQESNHPSRNPSRQNQESNHPSRNPSRQNQESNHPSLNNSQMSVRSGKSDNVPPLQDTPRRYSSASDRDLINKSRNGYIGTVYITDVKQYFEHASFDDVVLDTNKRYLEDLLGDFRKLLRDTLNKENEKLHDVEFVEKEDSTDALPGHSQLLIARSATFEALFKKFDNDVKSYLGFKLLSDDNERVKRVLLPKGDLTISHQLMEACLHYMYWGNIDDKLVKDVPHLKEFYETASFLDLKELRRHLAEVLYNNLASESKKGNDMSDRAIEFLKLAVKCGCKYLKKETIDFIVRNKSTILKHDAWKNNFSVDPNNKEIVKEIYQRMVEKSNENTK